MRIARFVTLEEGAEPQFGLVDGAGEQVVGITGDPMYTKVELTGAKFQLADLRLLAPVIPRSKVIGIRRNYHDHASEMGGEVPAEPGMFLVPNTAVVGPGDPVQIPDFVHEISYEGELAVVMGRVCRQVSADVALQYIFGYTCANDVTARDLQQQDGQWARAKGMDTFCPLGPWIETDLDPDEAHIVTRVGDQVRQDGPCSDMVFSVAELIAHASEAFTLLPGDVILTGTPAGVGPVDPGQVVEVEVRPIGVLRNPFVRL